MIGYLSGKVQKIFKDNLIINCNGVGYEVFMSSSNLTNFSENDPISVFVYTHVREDQIKLFGFLEKLEKEMFEAVISVSGVGPKIGLAVLSAGKISEIQKAISKADVGFFTKVKGLGKKGSQKIIIELKNKIGSINELDLNDDQVSSENEEVIEALIGFGFMRKDIVKVLEKIDSKLSEDDKIRMALRELGK